jgi:hypothetical protein
LARPCYPDGPLRQTRDGPATIVAGPHVNVVPVVRYVVRANSAGTRV